MDETISLKSITTARLAIIPHAQRAQALAAMARKSKRMPRPIGRGDRILAGNADNHDILLGLYVPTGIAGAGELRGIAVVRERYAPLMTPDVGVPGTDERAFLIDVVNLNDDMGEWRPSVRSLLIASAAGLIATTAHDPNYRTYVACRVAMNDDDLLDIVQSIGGRPLTAPPGVDLGRFCFNDVPSDELYFFDSSSAVNAATTLIQHLGVPNSLSRMHQLPRHRSFEALLSVEFSRPLMALIEEIMVLAEGGVNVGWQVPRIISNDDSFPMRVVNG